ncbi:CHAT domain-containing protein [Nodularia sp. NIES-3585]|uniref:CHAT domain-containing protein n=1 Tax=Nodularia sp. NIES-3585 TaxID=1973477 RepID=UPI000B5CC18E|nr:CHAT domain-containing protein [Nodularia sp. NIES-3585]GAX36538.1 protein prenyltransferase, alpha subunit [Nodularia sp. NIES-3585]
MNLKELTHKSSKDIIRSFDVDFDIPFEHDVSIGLLLITGAFKPNSPLEDRVGANWCQIVVHDVNYRLLEGLETIEKSKSDAEKLTQFIKHLNFDSTNNIDKYQAYVAARWHDAAGKIYYRVGEHTEARLNFEQAEKIVQSAKLWYCLPDIKSNFLRANYEENRIVSHQIDLASAYEELRLNTLDIAKNKNIKIPEPGKQNIYLQQESVENREFLRGLASILHNESVEYAKQGKIGLSLELSRKSEVICRSLSDKYRLAQALNHQAIRALVAIEDRIKNPLPEAHQKFEEVKTAFQSQDLYNIALELFIQVKNMPWKRGRQIAEQNIAKIYAYEGNFSKAVEVIKLLDELESERQVRGGDLGLDNDFYSYTVIALETVINTAEKANVENLGDYSIGELRKRLQKEKLTEIRSTRKVVKVSMYKRDFANKFSPTYLGLIADELNNDWEKAFSLIEEASCRELLDLLQTQNFPNTNWFRERPSIRLPLSQTTTDERRRGLRQIKPEMVNQETLELLNQIRMNYEQVWFNQPIPTSAHNPEIAHEVCMFTANEPVVIIRYFFYGNKKSPKLGAFVFTQGKIEYKDLDWQAIEHFIINKWEIPEQSESSLRLNDEVSQQLSELLIKPIWDLVGQDIKDFINQDKEPEPNSHLYYPHLVLIPSEKLFRLPLHIAFVPDTKIPLASAIPVSFSVSTTAYVNRGRHFSQRYPVKPDDDLCVLIKRDDEASGKELIDINWNPQHFHIAGQPPEGVSEYQDAGKCNREGLVNLIDKKPEFFIYSGHGIYWKTPNYVETFLELGEAEEEIDYLTQYDIATGIRLPRNKLTILAACVTAQGSDSDGGEVSGFIRSFMAAGCGALGLTLWYVQDTSIADCIRHLLTEIMKRKDSGKPFDVVYELYLYYRTLRKRFSNNNDHDSRKSSHRSPQAYTNSSNHLIESCPLILYL